MSFKSFPYTRPFKFVVVGECGSGKTTLIQKFVLGCRPNGETDENRMQKPTKPTFACDCHSVSLQTTVKQVCHNGESVAITRNDIACRLWYKKYYLSSAPWAKKMIMDLSQQRSDLAWDDIFVYLHKSVEQKCRIKSDELCMNRAMFTPNKTSRKFQQKRNTSEDIIEVTKSRIHCGYAALTESSNPVKIDVDIWDTGGAKNFMWYRWYACTGADVVLLCLPLSSVLSFNELRGGMPVSTRDREESEIVQKLQKFMSDELLSNRTKTVNYRIPPVLLVGTKSDQCETVAPGCSHVFECENKLQNLVGLKLATEIGCCDFVRCSGLSGSGVAAVFETALAVSLTSEGRYQASTGNASAELNFSDTENSLAKEVKDPTYFKIHSSQNKSKSKKINETANENYSKSNHNDETGSKAHTQLPRISFPPPPASSPPSTRSFSTSSTRTGSSSSLESVDGAILDYEESFQFMVPNCNNPPSNVSVFREDYKTNNDSTNGIKNIPETLTEVPTPTPRHRRKKNNVSQFQSHAEKGNTAEKVAILVAPKPKMRSLAPSARIRRRTSQQKRREGVFVKFLHLS